MNKRTLKRVGIGVLAALLIAVLSFALGSGGKDAPVEGNLLANSDFSAVTNGMPDGWETGMWVTSEGASYLEAVTLEDGTTAVLVENAAANDARFEQVVSVRENTTYRLSARVRAENCDPDKLGANVSFLGIYGTSDTVHQTDGVWETVELYARTGKGQTEATVCVRLGGYGSEAMGKAWFTDVVLEEVDEAPLGVSVLNIATPEPQKEVKEERSFSMQGVSIPLLIASFSTYLYFAWQVMRRPLREPANLRVQNPGKTLGMVLAIAFLLRFVLALLVDGYGVDIGCFSAWAGKMASGGPANFYEEGYFCDYPPAYMLVLGAIGWFANLIGASYGSAGMELLLKLVPIACDIALAAIVYRVACRRLGDVAALGLSALLALNPAFIVTGSCWGQIDSVLAVMLVLVLLLAQEGNWKAAIPLFALTVLTKPQAGLLAPLGIAALVKDWLHEDREEMKRKLIVGIGGGLLVTLAIALPFSLNQSSPFWLVEKYIETLSGYTQATLSTGNLMFLLGGNWVESSASVLGPITYGMLGNLLMVLSFAAGIFVYWKGEGRKNLFLASAVTMQMVFVLGTKMHERYILPALILLLLAYVATKDVRLLASFVVVSAISAVNIGVVLAYQYLIEPNMWLGYIISIVQIAALGLTIWATVDVLRGRVITLPEREITEEEEQAEEAQDDRVFAADLRMRRELLHANDEKLHMTRRDWAIMLGLTLAYAVVGFWGLGVMEAPQTGYASSAVDESVVIDLGEVREDFRIYYYGGISQTAFSFATSDDGVNYTEETDAYFDQGECFKWLAMRTPTYDEHGEVKGASGNMLSFSGRYLRVTFESAGSALWEVAAVDGEGNVYTPVGATASGAREGREADPTTLIDEQDTVPTVPSYMNSMYFDEIYHARTGYEHANSLYTYETTHPPLGKVFMSWCIELMGMTPFTWRFAGALTGVLMIPAIYLLAKQLFGRTLFAALSAAILSLDCMHFTQTRIATIDSFPVLFIMLMFLFMIRWTKMSFYHTKLWKTFVPLALSGVFMGLAISSKWIGCYSAVGLAIMFFARFYSLWRQSLYAQKHRHEDERFAHAASVFKKYGAITIGACCVFFVVVPLIIYCLSYIPYLSAYGEVTFSLKTFQRIIDNQISMFGYHSDLDATHYFSSPWYEWPVIGKPMWYYNADFKGAGMASSILAFGNPAVWWTGLVGILFMLGYSIYRNTLPALRVIPGRDDDMDRAMPAIAIGFLSAYLPWVLISRLTFIYHYFASVPFIILATVQGLRYIERRWPTTAKALCATWIIASLILFIAFYPLASGVEVPRAWCDAVSWFDGWMWY